MRKFAIIAAVFAAAVATPASAQPARWVELPAREDGIIRLGNAEKVDPTPPALRSAAARAPQTPAAVSRDIDGLDAVVRAGLADLRRAVAELEKDRESWAKLDKSLHTARTVNAALLAKAEGMVAVHEERVGPALKLLRERLKAAPALYERLAADRRAKAGKATFDAERESYETQAALADVAAALCRARYREVYEATDPKALSAADALDEAMAQVRRMAAAHRGWAEVLDAWPSTLNDPKLAAMVDQLNRYCEQMVAQQKGMAKLTDALKATAEVKK